MGVKRRGSAVPLSQPLTFYNSMANLMILQELESSPPRKSSHSKHRKGSPAKKVSESPNRSIRLKAAKSRMKHLASKTFHLWARTDNQDDVDLAEKMKNLASPTVSQSIKAPGAVQPDLKLQLPLDRVVSENNVKPKPKYLVRERYGGRENLKHSANRGDPSQRSGIANINVEGLIGKANRLDKTLISDYEEMLLAVSKKPIEPQKKYQHMANQVELRPTTPAHLPGKTYTSLKRIRQENKFHKEIGTGEVLARRLNSKSNTSISRSKNPEPEFQVSNFEKEFGIEYLPVAAKLKNLGYLKPTLLKLQDLLKISFGLFTQEKHDLFFKQVKALVDVIFVYRLLPFDLMVQLAQLCIEIFFDFSEFNKCNWVTQLLVGSIEGKVAKDERWNEKGFNSHNVNTAQSRPKRDVQIRQVRSLSKLGIRSNFFKSSVPKLLSKSDVSPASHVLLETLLKLYQQQSRSFQSSGQTLPALLATYKWLFLALYLQESGSEMSAYDTLGKIYTEIGQIVRGRYFNLKYSDCIEESPTSPVRKFYPELRKKFMLVNMEVHGRPNVEDDEPTRDPSPDLPFYESIPLKGQALLAELEEKRKEAYRKEFEEIREEARLGVTKDPLYAGLRKKKKPITKKNLIGNIQTHNGFVPTEATDDVQLLLSKAKIQFNNCSETVVLTHQSPNRTILIHHQTPNPESNNPYSLDFKQDRIEPFLLEKNILPLVDKFNSCGLILEKYIETVEKLELQYKKSSEHLDQVTKPLINLSYTALL